MQHQSPRALDLFCGAGGAAAGLMRAGFDVTGIDIEPQPNYPGLFILGDALAPPVDVHDYDFVWASPPCQRWSPATKDAGRYPDLIPLTRDVISGARYSAIENVPRAPIRRDLYLTLSMFLGAPWLPPRLRHFELNFSVMQPSPLIPSSRNSLLQLTGRCHGHRRVRERRKRFGLPPTPNVREIEFALGITHIKRGTVSDRKAQLAQCVPPAYSQYIGAAVMCLLGRER